MPSTVRKLADALGVDPPILMADVLKDVHVVPDEPEEQGAEPILDAWARKLEEAFSEVMEADLKESARAKEGWHEDREWAENFVSGDSVGVGSSYLSEEHIASMRSRADEQYPRYGVLSSLVSYPEDLDVARSRLASNDPKKIVEAARLVLRRAMTIVEEYESRLHSFHRIPDHYYEDPAAQSRIKKLQKALSEKHVAAAQAVQELVALFDESLDTLEDQILGMRKESDLLEKFVRQAQK
jgi:hypothetical protein